MTVQTLETNKNIDYTCIPYGGDRYFLSHVIVTIPKNKDELANFVFGSHKKPATESAIDGKKKTKNK